MMGSGEGTVGHSSPSPGDLTEEADITVAVPTVDARWLLHLQMPLHIY